MSDPGLWFINSHVRIVVAQDGNADGFSVLEHLLPFGDAPPLHVHREEDEIFHILAGEVRFEVDGRTSMAQAGDTLLAPRGRPHRYRVISPEGARYLTITRGGFERMVRAVARPATGAVLPPQAEPDEATRRVLFERCAEAGIDLIGPPLD